VLERVPVRRYVADNPPACEPEVGALTLPYPPAQAARPLDKAAGAVDVVAAKSMQRHAHGRLRPRQVQNLCNIAVSGVTARWGCTPRLVRLPSWCKLASLTLDASARPCDVCGTEPRHADLWLGSGRMAACPDSVGKCQRVQRWVVSGVRARAGGPDPAAQPRQPRGNGGRVPAPRGARRDAVCALGRARLAWRPARLAAGAVWVTGGCRAAVVAGGQHDVRHPARQSCHRGVGDLRGHVAHWQPVSFSISSALDERS